MPLMKLSHEQMRQLDEQPELAMGIHVMQRSDTDGEIVNPAFVLGGQVALIWDDDAIRAISQLFSQGWGRRDEQIDDENIEAFEAWRARLPAAPPLRQQPVDRSIIAFVLHSSGYVLAPPRPPLHIYGHLPFSGTTGSRDIFYRCEPWPISRRIDRTNRIIRPGTYACPASELPFFPTGFAAVGRYALPNLMPACYRWKIKPAIGASLDCGASVPLYGQAGGGVEVRFRALTHNRGPIASPVVLPAL